jgi:hypothetical protein
MSAPVAKFRPGFAAAQTRQIFGFTNGAGLIRRLDVSPTSLQLSPFRLHINNRSFLMLTIRTLAIAAATVTLGLAGCAQTPMDQDAHHPDAAPSSGMSMPMRGTSAPMIRMDEQLKTMQVMHDKMMRAKTPERRSALMAEQMKVMQESMAMMGGTTPSAMMGQGAMAGMNGDATKGACSGGMHGMGSMNGAMGMHHQMMEKRMQMMQSMMQAMMDRMHSVADKP